MSEELYRAVSIARDLDWNGPALREHIETEYATYALMRQHLPVAYSEHVREWFLFRYDDCKEAFQRPDLFSNNMIERPVHTIPQQMDPPEQREYRRVLDPLFTPQAMDRLEPDIRAFAADLLDPIAARGECEFIEDFAVPFPTIIFCWLMGFPLEDHPKLMHWNHILIDPASTYVARVLGITDLEKSGRPSKDVVERIQYETAAEVVAYLTELLEQKRREPKDDLMSRLLAARFTGDRLLTQDELINMCYLFFLAGLDTVTGMLSLIMRDFAERPDHRRTFVALMDDPERATTAVEELVRYHSSVPPDRRVTRDCEFHGLQLRENDVIRMMVPSADRDECQFANADELNFDRLPNPHLGFAVGPHRCLGIHLARREVRIGLQEWHRRMPEYVLEPGAQARLYTGGLRGVQSLPLVIQSASAR